MRAFGRPVKTALTIATSLAQIGEFSFILAGLGVSLGLLSEQARDVLLAAAIVSILVNPLLFVALDRWIARHDSDAPEDHADAIAGHTVLVGLRARRSPGVRRTASRRHAHARDRDPMRTPYANCATRTPPKS